MIETVINKKFVIDGAEQDVSFTIESTHSLNEQVINEIEEITLSIYWSDSRCVHWSFDTKLSHGIWIENIKYNNELTTAEALILN